jgi:hypothetical protein
MWFGSWTANRLICKLPFCGRMWRGRESDRVPHLCALSAASFDVALTYGGPAVAVWGWIAVSICVVCVSLNMAELSSAVRKDQGLCCNSALHE